MYSGKSSVAAYANSDVSESQNLRSRLVFTRATRGVNVVLQGSPQVMAL